MRQLIRVIELYFTQLDSMAGNEAMSYRAEDFYGGTFHGNFDGPMTGMTAPINQLTSNSDQTAPNVATANAVQMDTVAYTNDITLASGSHIVFGTPGVYLVTPSIQYQNATNDIQYIDLWLRQNGTNIANTNSQFSILARKNATTPSSLITVTPYIITVAAGDYLQTMWRVSDVGVTIQQLPAVSASGTTPAIPATPSVILTVNFLSAS
jgi:hypothetical protein